MVCYLPEIFQIPGGRGKASPALPLGQVPRLVRKECSPRNFEKVVGQGSGEWMPRRKDIGKSSQACNPRTFVEDNRMEDRKSYYLGITARHLPGQGGGANSRAKPG